MKPRITSAYFNVTDQLVIIYSAYVKYVRKNEDTMGQSISYLRTSNTAYDKKEILYSEPCL
jgi:hypothetical protein